MKKNIDAKIVKEYVKKVNTYKKYYKVTPNRNVNKESNKQNKEKKITITNIQKCA